MSDLYRTHRARLWRGGDVRLEGRWYLVAVTPHADDDISYWRLDELYRRLLTLDGARREYLDVYQLEVLDPSGESGFWWVPTRTAES